jgi:N-acetylglutamate synthase-like GNAT family acetyltransferase
MNLQRQAMTLSASVRIASPNDHDDVSRLLKASFSVLLRCAYEPSVLKAALPFMTVAQVALLRSGTYYVAETKKGAVVGCGGWTRERPGTGEVLPRLGHIRHFGVHPDWIGRGIGRAIFDRCRKDAKAAGVKRFECYSSLNGEAFYSALGFGRLGQIEVEMPDRVSFPSVHMIAEI